jgi:phosphoserine phosphatase
MRRSPHSHLPQFLIETIRKRHMMIKAQFSAKKGAAFFDFDGSLIDGDITEGKRKGESLYAGLVDRAILAGLVPEFVGEEGLKKFWSSYDAITSAEDAYLWVDQLVSKVENSKAEDFQNFMIQHLTDIVEKNLFSFARELLDFCISENIEPFVVSASPHLFVEQLHHCLPLKRENLFGLYVNGIAHNAVGKAKRVEKLCESRSLYPLLALGNKWQWDGLMIQKACDEGGVGILVNETSPKTYDHEFLYCLDVM